MSEAQFDRFEKELASCDDDELRHIHSWAPVGDYLKFEFVRFILSEIIPSPQFRKRGTAL